MESDDHRLKVNFKCDDGQVPEFIKSFTVNFNISGNNGSGSIIRSAYIRHSVCGRLNLKWHLLADAMTLEFFLDVSQHTLLMRPHLSFSWARLGLRTPSRINPQSDDELD